MINHIEWVTEPKVAHLSPCLSTPVRTQVGIQNIPLSIHPVRTKHLSALSIPVHYRVGIQNTPPTYHVGSSPSWNTIIIRHLWWDSSQRPLAYRSPSSQPASTRSGTYHMTFYVFFIKYFYKNTLVYRCANVMKIDTGSGKTFYNMFHD